MYMIGIHMSGRNVQKLDMVVAEQISRNVGGIEWRGQHVSGRIVQCAESSMSAICPQLQLLQLPSRLINYHWMHDGILASQLPEWLAATASRRA